MTEERNDGVKLLDIVKALELEIIEDFGKLESTLITSVDVIRPGLQLAGSYFNFVPGRIQIVGNMEISFLGSLESQARQLSLDKLFATDIPCLIIARSNQPRPEMLEAAEKYQIPLLRSELATSELTGAIVQYLKRQIAPSITVHGVLVEIHGEGILLLGESGVGKSETALEIIRRGHRLIADDLVEIRKISNTIIIGRSPELIRHLIEIRGLGILDVRELFGVVAVKSEENINFVVRLEAWDESKNYDRTGLAKEYTEILGIKIPSITIPVCPGRNMAVIVETAALNFRQKSMGYDAADALWQRVYPEGELRLAKVKNKYLCGQVSDKEKEIRGKDYSAEENDSAEENYSNEKMTIEKNETK